MMDHQGTSIPLQVDSKCTMSNLLVKGCLRRTLEEMALLQTWTEEEAVHLLKRWETTRNSHVNSDQEMVRTVAEEVATMTIEVSLKNTKREATSTAKGEPEEATESQDHSIPLKSKKVLIDLALVSRSSEAIAE